MKNILVLTDFSKAATNAAHYAARMAFSLKANILLLHIYEIPVTFSEVPVVINQEQIIIDAEAQLNVLTRELETITKGSVSINAHVKIGIFYSKLEAICKHLHPYAVIMGSQGSTAADRFLFGGHTVYAIKHLKWPVIAVPVEASFHSIKQIGLACDLETMIVKLPIDEISMLIHDFHAQLHILNIGKQSTFNPELIINAEHLEEQLKEFTPEFHFLSGGDIDTAIINFAEKTSLDLLIVLPKRHSLLDRMIHHSHTRKLVLHSHVPVMTFSDAHLSASQE